MRTHASLVPNPNSEKKTKKQKKTQHMQNKNSTRFYYKNEIRT
jgi:hypothetical protein